MGEIKNENENTDKKDEGANEIRVTDRRRIYLKPNGTASSSEAAETPNLKPTYVEELEARTKAAEKLAQEVQSRFDQLRAKLQQETDETRQRLNRSADERAERRTADFIAALLPVLDNLRRATEATESGSSPEQISEGVRQTAASFENALAAAGVEPIESIGQDFDPEFHEAVETIEVEPDLEGKVIDEYSRGYRMGERLLRPSRVKVGRVSNKVQGVGE
ncbi:MAG TPA: nucleotide exchange factor GrpE [Pyrinomonadaceae bacterium]|nr:nucleotide exchange factor GrpE [Pyrinomonadaceae bacterium]